MSVEEVKGRGYAPKDDAAADVASVLPPSARPPFVMN